jgi:SsrA-binding protein
MAEQYNIQFKNKKARFQYHIISEFTAGMVLQGSEVKSVRGRKVNLSDAYCTFIEDELYVVNLHIAPYEQASYFNHEAKRERKLLLNRTELRKLHKAVKEKGVAIIPIMLYVNEKGLIKLEIGLAKGKKFYDKRDSLKEKDKQRDLDRQLL